MTPAKDHLDIATLAGGCFWCLESDLTKQPGVEEAISGYSGGHTVDPTYEEVCSGMSGHLEVVRIRIDTNVLSYRALLDIFWRHVDPTDPGGQFVDRGSQYRTAIFFHDEVQKAEAEASRRQLTISSRFDKPIATEILPANKFYPAEPYHQAYYKHHPIRYKFYRHNSGRNQFFKKVWAEQRPKKSELREKPRHTPSGSTTA